MDVVLPQAMKLEYDLDQVERQNMLDSLHENP